MVKPDPEQGILVGTLLHQLLRCAPAAAAGRPTALPSYARTFLANQKGFTRATAAAAHPAHAFFSGLC